MFYRRNHRVMSVRMHAPTRTGKDSIFHVSHKFRNADSEEQTLWVCCFVNFESKVMEYLKKGTQVYVCGDVYADVFHKEDGSHVPSVKPECLAHRALGQSG